MPVRLWQVKKQPGNWRLWAVLFPLFLGLAIILSPAGAAPKSIPLDSFWEQVSRTRDWLDSAHSPAEWAGQAQAWSQIAEIERADGQVLKVDTAEIVRLLSAESPDVEKLKSSLTAVAAGRERWAQGDCGDCKAGLLSSILARPEFNPDQSENSFQQFIAQILDKVSEWLNALLGGSGGAGSIPPEVFSLVIAILLAAILLVVFRDTFSSLVKEADLAGEIPGESQPLTASLANQKAVQLSGAGDYRSAMRYLYLSALLLLDERGLLRYNRSLTNREYLGQVCGLPELENNLRAVVDEFDRVWYGFQAVDQDEYDRYVRHVAAIEALKK